MIGEQNSGNIYRIQTRGFPTKGRLSSKFRSTRMRAIQKGFDGLLFKWLSFPYSMEVVKQVHEGFCGAYKCRENIVG